MSNDVTDSVLLASTLPTASGQSLGILTLNRPKALNSLNLELITALRSQLLAWQQDANIVAIWLQGSDKALCAGGDIRELQQRNASATTPNAALQQASDFFSAEYGLYAYMARYSKPIITWCGGIVMGGGLGLTAAASHRIVTETSRIAMPEITIGLYPDVGGSWFLPRMPGRVGLFLALTGAPLNAHDARVVNLADWFVKSDDKLAIFAGLVTVPWAENPADNHGKLAKLLRGFAAQAESHLPASMVRAHFDTIQRVTDGDTLEEVSALIADHASDDVWMQRAAKALVVGSPTSAALSWELNRCARHLGLADVFRLEWTLSVQCCAHPDFPEGVRALLVDKDGLPHWSPATLADVTSAWLDAHFAQPTVTHPLADLGE